MDFVAYAAVVSTIALVVSAITATIQVQKWLNEGVKLRLSIMPEALLVGGARDDPDSYLVLTVVNRGTASTTLTHMVLYQFDNWWSKAKMKPSKTRLVIEHGLPYVLKPGEQWIGRARHDGELPDLLKTGQLYAGVVGSHRARPYLIHASIAPKKGT